MIHTKIKELNIWGGTYSTIEQVPDNRDIVESAPNGQIKPIFENGFWIEGATEQEIQAYNITLCPQTITRRQLRKQLVILGFDLAVIESMITDPLTLIDWQDSTIFERQNESVISIGTNLEIDLNDFFTNASLL
jgi:hypothetical protein